VQQVSSTNARGPVETDQSNGAAAENDGALITIDGRRYTRGLGTTAPAEIVYYLGGRCSLLVSDVGMDDEMASTVPATFTVYVDDTVAAASGPVGSGEAPRTLTANLTGARWLRLVTTGSGTASDGTSVNDHTDWATPVLTCGNAAPSDPVLPVEQTLASFESGTTENWTIVNVGDGGSVTTSTAFHTDGGHGLEVFTPVAGNWFGRLYAEPLDLTGKSMLKFDVAAGATAGTTGEIAVQSGPDFTWCQGGKWAWTNPGSTRTIVEPFGELGCSGGVSLDPSQIRAVWVFLNGGDVQIDNLRAE
jgi:alpha-galactosidase